LFLYVKRFVLGDFMNVVYRVPATDCQDRVPAGAMMGWNVDRGTPLGCSAFYQMASTFKRLVSWRSVFFFLELEA